MPTTKTLHLEPKTTNAKAAKTPKIGKTPKTPPRTTLLVATKKGAFLLRSDASRKRWSIEGPHFLGSIIHHLIADPRDGGATLLMAMRDGHLGPTVRRSTDGGKTWIESSTPPRFPKATNGEPRGNAEGNAKSVTSVFWLTAGHASEPGVFYAGTTPYGLFRSSDGGATWDEVEGFRGYIDGLGKPDLFGEVPGGGPITHSIRIDPRDAKHLYVCISGGGIFETLDRGETWRPLNKGVDIDFLPPAEHEIGQDPHCLVVHPTNPDRVWHQNHCGIYRIDRPSDRWERVGRAMPKEIGDIGFGIVTHPKDPDTAWVFPMDGTSVWPRTSPGGKPAVYRTKDAGRTWKRFDKGLPREHAYFTVFRQSFCHDQRDPLGLYFGTTSGEIWASLDEGTRWTQIAAHLPHVYAVEAM